MRAFGALSQPTRFSAFELLVKAAPDGVAAGQMAVLLGVPQNTLSTHLVVLERDVGLIESERHGRSVIYKARPDRLESLLGFFLQQCCQGRPERCHQHNPERDIGLPEETGDGDEN